MSNIPVYGKKLRILSLPNKLTILNCTSHPIDLRYGEPYSSNLLYADYKLTVYKCINISFKPYKLEVNLYNGDYNINDVYLSENEIRDINKFYDFIRELKKSDLYKTSNDIICIVSYQALQAINKLGMQDVDKIHFRTPISVMKRGKKKIASLSYFGRIVDSIEEIKKKIIEKKKKKRKELIEIEL